MSQADDLLVPRLRRELSDACNENDELRASVVDLKAKLAEANTALAQEKHRHTGTKEEKESADERVEELEREAVEANAQRCELKVDITRAVLRALRQLGLDQALDKIHPMDLRGALEREINVNDDDEDPAPYAGLGFPFLDITSMDP